MYSHERSLVEQLSDKPFSLIGVNSDRDREKIQQVVKDKNITWRSFWDLAKEDDRISKQWQIQGWPTLFLIDADGVIRAKWIGGSDEIDQGITELLAEVGSEVELTH